MEKGYVYIYIYTERERESVCVCVCVCVCECIIIFKCLNVYICIYMCIYINVCVCVFVCVCVCVCEMICQYVNDYFRICICVCVCVCVCVWLLVLFPYIEKIKCKYFIPSLYRLKHILNDCCFLFVHSCLSICYFSGYYVHLQTNTLGKCMNPFIDPVIA